MAQGWMGSHMATPSFLGGPDSGTPATKEREAGMVTKRIPSPRLGLREWRARQQRYDKAREFGVSLALPVRPARVSLSFSSPLFLRDAGNPNLPVQKKKGGPRLGNRTDRWQDSFVLLVQLCTL